MLRLVNNKLFKNIAAALATLLVVGIIGIYLTQKGTIRADSLIEGHTCDLSDIYCIDVMDILPQQTADAATRSVPEITQDRLNKAIENSQKRVENLTGKKVTKGEASTRNKSEAVDEWKLIDGVMTIDYYNYEKKFGSRPQTSAAQTRDSSNELTFKWDDDSLKEAGIAESDLAKLKKMLPAIYKAHTTLFGSPLFPDGNRKVKISHNPANDIVGKDISSGFYIPPITINYLGSKAKIGDAILLTPDQSLASYIIILAHEMSHAWRADKVLTIAGSSQMEEGLATFSENKVLKYMMDHSDEVGFDKALFSETEIDLLAYDAELFPPNFNYHDNIYSTIYDGKLNFASVVLSDSSEYISDKYDLGGAAMGKLYLANNDFVKNLNSRLSALSGVLGLNNKELKTLLVDAVGKKTIVDRQYAIDFVNNLPIFSELSTKGKYIIGDLPNISFIDKETSGLVTTQMGSGKAKLNNSFGWPNELEMKTGSNNAWKLSKTPSDYYVKPGEVTNYGRTWLQIGEYKGAKQNIFAEYTKDPPEFGTAEGIDLSYLPKIVPKYLVSKKKPLKKEGSTITEYLAKKQSIPIESINSNLVMGVIDTTGNALNANFYCNEKLIDTKNIFASSATKQYNSGPTPITDFAPKQDWKIYYPPTYSTNGCSGNATIVVKMREPASDESSYYWTRLTIDGGHIFPFDPKESHWSKVSPVSNVSVNKNGRNVKISFTTTQAGNISLKCPYGGAGFSRPIKLISVNIPRKGRWYFQAKNGLGSRTNCWLETPRSTYDGVQMVKSKTFGW